MAPVIALAGFMGSGKTTVGRRAALLLDWDFLDLDAEVVAAAAQTIPTLFADEGEPAFRQRECRALRAALQRVPEDRGLILALGGGTLTNPEALDCLRKRAIVAYLQVDAADAWQRVCHSDRPLARDPQAFAALLEERRTIYESAADHVIDVEGRSVEAVAREVAELASSTEQEVR